jgi:lysophospholipid acyltransferase (LPLAT)-like uncharacterized protein
VVPASYRLSRKWTLKSWDRFQIPMPFSECVIRFEAPIQVQRELSDAEREAVRQQVQDRLRAMTMD